VAHRIRTEIFIAAEPQAVWAVLTDFPSHTAWDPWLVNIAGVAAQGEKLTVRFRGGMTLRPTITEARDGAVLEWLGKLVVPGLVDGRHRFDLVPEAGGTRLVHSEEFTGVLVPLVKRALTKVERSFAEFNAALMQRVERPS
jgi:hypothetical protein